MWHVLEHRRVEKQLAKAPLEVQKRYQKWVDIVAFSGPAGLQQIRGFKDERLAGNWNGFRSSRLNHQYRVLYRQNQDQFEVHVVELTPHDYRRRS